MNDSIEGWADAVKALVQSYFKGGSKLRFDYSDIRPKGARLVTSGGKAPGPQPLKECLVKLQGMFEAKENGDKLSTIEAHDMICHIADAVLAGGIRRAALISLFSADDNEMIAAKTGNWWEHSPQRGELTTLLFSFAIESPRNILKTYGRESKSREVESRDFIFLMTKTGEPTLVVKSHYDHISSVI